MKQTVILFVFLSLLIAMGSKPASSTLRVSTRAREQALQTDKFPRPPERAVSQTTQPKTQD